MSTTEPVGWGLQNAQRRVELLLRHTHDLLLEPELLSVALEELSVVLEELQQQYDELLGNRYQQHEELLTLRQTLKQQQQQYQALFNNIADGYLVTDAQGVIQEANQAVGNLFGVRQDLLVGKPLLVFVANDDRRSFHTYLTRLQAGAQLRTWTIQFQPRDGESFPAMVEMSAIYNDRGDLTGWRWLIRDITTLKQAEAVLLKELATEKELSELKSHFIETVSHEFRTPMAIILMSAELLERHGHQASDEKKQQYAERIRNGIRYMDSLITNVLSYGQTEAGKQLFNPTPQNLEAFCQEVVGQHQSCEGDRHTLCFDHDGSCDVACIDTVLAQQILNNLLSNALKYSPAGTPVLLKLRCSDNHVMINVRDTGLGIPPEQQSRLFQPFYRARNVGTIPGTGLGLAIVKQAIDLHGGEITVESALDEGTTFTITLPLTNCPS